jgi:hypothetical protein
MSALLFRNVNAGHFLRGGQKGVPLIQITLDLADGLDLTQCETTISPITGYDPNGFRNIALGLPVTDLFLAGPLILAVSPILKVVLLGIVMKISSV